MRTDLDSRTQCRCAACCIVWFVDECNRTQSCRTYKPYWMCKATIRSFQKAPWHNRSTFDKLLVAGGKKEGLIWTAWRNRTHVQISDSYTAQLDRSPVRYHGAQYCPPRLLGRFVSYNYRVHHSDPELKSPLDRATTGGWGSRLLPMTAVMNDTHTLGNYRNSF